MSENITAVERSVTSQAGTDVIGAFIYVEFATKALVTNSAP